jgi:hypothetical protein
MRCRKGWLGDKASASRRRKQRKDAKKCKRPPGYGQGTMPIRGGGTNHVSRCACNGSRHDARHQ